MVGSSPVRDQASRITRIAEAIPDAICVVYAIQSCSGQLPGLLGATKIDRLIVLSCCRASAWAGDRTRASDQELDSVVIDD